MTSRKLRFLELLLTGPQTLRAFSAVVVGITTLKPCRCLIVLRQLAEEGAVEHVSGDMFRITAAGREALAQHREAAPAPAAANITPPRTFGNHAMREPYRTPRWEPARAGADEHQHFASLRL